jgi:Domain of unknown function (DUF4157)
MNLSPKFAEPGLRRGPPERNKAKSESAAISNDFSLGNAALGRVTPTTGGPMRSSAASFGVGNAASAAGRIATPLLERPRAAVQRKACSQCGSPSRKESGPCTACAARSGKASLVNPLHGALPRRPKPSPDPAERQAEEIGARIAADLPRSAVGSGSVPTDVRVIAERHLGVDLSGARLEAGATGHQRAASERAWAVTEGNDISFLAGQLTLQNAEGRQLLGHELTHVAQQRSAASSPVQKLGWDDVSDAASDFVGGASEAYEAVASSVSESAESAAETVEQVGTAVGSSISDVAEAVSDAPERTRADLRARVASAQREASNTDRRAVPANQQRVSAINQQIVSLNAATSMAAVPFLPVLVPIAEVVGEILAAIAAFLLGATAATLLIIAIIVIAIILLIIYLLRDTKVFPETDTGPTGPTTAPREDREEDPQERRDPRGRPDDRPPPPLLPRILPDCCQEQLQPTTTRIDRRHSRYGAKTIRVHDGRAKHWQNIKRSGPQASCDCAFLEEVLSRPPENHGPCLHAWKAAVTLGNATYGGQMGSDTAPDRAAIVKRVVEEGEEIRPSRYWGDAGKVVGVDIETGRATTMARIDGLPDEAHVIPQERRPT